jgi:amino acid transporter
VFVGFLRIFLLGILIFKRLTARRLYNLFGVKGLVKVVAILVVVLMVVLVLVVVLVVVVPFITKDTLCHQHPLAQ